MKSLYYKYNIFYIFLICILIIDICIFVFLYNNRGCNNHKNIVAFLDIGQGDAVYIENKYGQNILIDTGDKGSEVLKQIRKINICNKVHIDDLILTHPDKDHIGEAENLIKKNIVENVIHNGFLDINQKDESDIENNLEKIIKQKNIKIQNIVNNKYIDIKDFNVDILFPINETYKDKGKVDDNDYSIVLKLSYSGTSFMLTGDAPMKVEKEIIEKYCEKKATNTCPMLKSDVLKLGHHGSKNSTSINWLKNVDAVDYIVSASKNNKYNHPNEETLYRVYLNKKDSRIRETSLEGNIVYVLD